MPVEFAVMQSFEGKRVKMRFADGHECIATLLSAVQDIEGNNHLIYENLEWSDDPRELATSLGAKVYAEAESLLEISRPSIQGMNYAMEIHDSILKDFSVLPDGSGFLLFDAVIFRSQGEVFEDAHESGWQTLRFDFDEMIVQGDLRKENYLLDGSITINGATTDDIVFLPAQCNGEILFQFDQPEDFEMRSVRATSMRSSLEGEFEIEHYWDADGNITPASTG